MKIVLITGHSGAGKTSIFKELTKNTERYNPIYSFTDRPQRGNEESDHTFVDSYDMDKIMEKEIIVASTQIDEYRYCTILSQFHEDKVNVYIVDAYGVNDVIDAFPRADIMTLLIQRDDVDIDDYREGRDIAVPIREDVHFLINNDSTIQSAAQTIDTLVAFDFFMKPSHKVVTIEESLEKIDEQRRYLSYIERSLLIQRWIRDKPLFKKMCECLDKTLKENFDFTIEIETYEEPDVSISEIAYPIHLKIPADLTTWDIEQNIYEKAQQCIYKFCDKFNCRNIAYHVFLFVDYEEEEI